ncbi:hypothetical protein MJD09_14445 [bacterium]|nr:hypothetical protein [bacterium]
MHFSNASVPVFVDVSPSELKQSIFKIEGVLSYADQTVTFEYRTRDKRFQTSAVKTFQLHLDALREVNLKRRMLGSMIILCPRRFAVLDQVPWTSTDEIVLLVRRQHRERAAVWTSQLQLVLSETNARKSSSIPFQLPDTKHGLKEHKGLLYLEEGFIVFEVGSGLTGGYKKERQIIKVELCAVETMRLGWGLLRDRLHVSIFRSNFLTMMSGKYKEEVKLKIRKRHLGATKQLINEVKQLKTTETT